MNGQNIISNKLDLFWTTLFSYSLMTSFELKFTVWNHGLIWHSQVPLTIGILSSKLYEKVTFSITKKRRHSGYEKDALSITI